VRSTISQTGVKSLILQCFLLSAPNLHPADGMAECARGLYRPRRPRETVCVHFFGNLLNFHPHLNIMAIYGGFTLDGIFDPLPAMILAPIEELFRHRVFRMLLREGLLTPERIRLMRSWAHSGFNVNAQVRIGADDTAGRENLARYLIRAPSR
jgi:hypothetical protein